MALHRWRTVDRQPVRGFRPFERINNLALIAKPFEPGVEMTLSLTLKRNVIGEIFKDRTSQLFTSRN
jgi:long-chain acyl-CoA synthetase